MSDNKEVPEFDTTPTSAEQIWHVLMSNKSSTPGDDNITNHHLWKLPSTHAFLAILFNKIIESGQPPPSSWSSACIRLTCKGSDTNSPSNFKPIALSSCTGKLLNKLIATEQTKFLSITELEAENHFWRRIMDGLPSGQLSSLLRAGFDTLPTPMNLQRYKIQVSSHCKLCQRPQTTTGHILSACREALEMGRYTWRHDFVLLSLVRSLGKAMPNIQIYADLDN